MRHSINKFSNIGVPEVKGGEEVGVAPPSAVKVGQALLYVQPPACCLQGHATGYRHDRHEAEVTLQPPRPELVCEYIMSLVKSVKREDRLNDGGTAITAVRRGTAGYKPTTCDRKARGRQL